MRKWFPITVVGLGGLGVLLFSDRGRRTIRWVMEHLPLEPHQLAEWNEAAQKELDRIQNALNQVAETLREDPMRSQQSSLSH